MGNPTNLFSPKESIEIVFDPTYVTPNKQPKLYYQKEGQNHWFEVPTESFRNEIGLVRSKGIINGNLAPGYYSLKIFHEANRVEFVNSPAFFIQSDYSSDSLALAEFYDSTNGEEWINNQGWLQSPNLEDLVWYNYRKRPGGHHRSG